MSVCGVLLKAVCVVSAAQRESNSIPVLPGRSALGTNSDSWTRRGAAVNQEVGAARVSELV